MRVCFFDSAYMINSDSGCRRSGMLFFFYSSKVVVFFFSSYPATVILETLVMEQMAMQV